MRRNFNKDKIRNGGPLSSSGNGNISKCDICLNAAYGCMKGPRAGCRDFTRDTTSCISGGTLVAQVGKISTTRAKDGRHHK